jgi:hypothetical protein
MYTSASNQLSTSSWNKKEKTRKGFHVCASFPLSINPFDNVGTIYT